MARLRPLGARLEKAGARGKRRYRSHSLHTGFPYGAVDSLIASFSSRSRRQADKRRKSLLTVPKRRRSHSPGERIASPSLEPTTTLSSFLGCPSRLPYSHPPRFPPGVEALERAAKYITHRHVLPPFPPGGAAPQRLVQNPHSGSISLAASTYPERRRPSPFHAGFIIQCRPKPIFIPIGGPKAHPALSMTGTGTFICIDGPKDI